MLEKKDFSDISKSMDLEIVKNIGARTPLPFTFDDAAQFVVNCQKAVDNQECFDYCLRDKKTHEFIGISSLHVAVYGGCQRPGMLGYWIVKDYRKKGYALEALEAMSNLALSFGINEIWATCRYDNTGSINLLKKFGMHLYAESTGLFLGKRIKTCVYEKTLLS